MGAQVDDNDLVHTRKSDTRPALTSADEMDGGDKLPQRSGRDICLDIHDGYKVNILFVAFTLPLFCRNDAALYL